MSARFGRDYDLIIGSGETAITIRPPMRIVFSCTKSINGRGVNRMDLKIYNLKRSTRLQLVKDAEEVKYIPFVLSVGYDGKLQTLFKGSVMEGSNTRAGADHITTFNSLDGGYDAMNSFTSATVKGKAAAMDKMLADMPNTLKGKITDLPGLSRPKVIVGNTIKMIDAMMAPGETWFIDNEQLFVVKDNEIISAYVPVISASTGLINTPERSQRVVTCQTLLNPTLKIGGVCELKSKNAPHLNGIYKIDTIAYNGDIDGSDWSQSVSMMQKNNYTEL